MSTNNNLQELFGVLPAHIELDKECKKDEEIGSINKQITKKQNCDKINLIELFYASCLNQLPDNHPLIPHLEAAYATEPASQI